MADPSRKGICCCTSPLPNVRRPIIKPLSLSCMAPRYNSDALELIKGKKSQEIEQILGYEYGAVALHRDDMIML